MVLVIMMQTVRQCLTLLMVWLEALLMEQSPSLVTVWTVMELSRQFQERLWKLQQINLQIQCPWASPTQGQADNDGDASTAITP